MLNDLELKELLRYSRYVTLNQSEPSPDRLASNQLTQAEQNTLHDLPEEYTPPTYQDVVQAVADVLTDIAPHKATPAMSKGKTMNNTLYDTFNAYGSLQEMPATEQDFFVGMCRNPLTDGDNTHFSVEQIFMILKAKKTLNPEDLMNWLNIKRRIRGYRDCDLSMSRKIIKKIVNIMQAWELLGLLKCNALPADLSYDLYIEVA